MAVSSHSEFVHYRSELARRFRRQGTRRTVIPATHHRTVGRTQEGVSVEEYGAGEIVLFPGSGSKLYRLHRGLIRLHTVDDDGFGVTLRYVKPGGYFGEEAFTELDRRYFAEAVTDSSAELLDPNSLDRGELLSVTRFLASSIERMNRSLLRLAGKPLRARVAAELLELSDTDLADRSPDGAAVIHLTHDDLAAAVGSVRETVTKVIGELVRSGAVQAGYAKIKVSDAELLNEIAGN